MNHIKRNIIGAVGLLLVGVNFSFGQLVIESFPYSDGNLVGNGNWVNFSGTSGQIQVGSGVITLTDANSEDARVTFTAQSSGTVYFGYDIQVTDPSSYTGTDFEYFSGFADGTTFENKVDIAAFSASGWKPGISNSAATAEATWASDLAYATTFRIVVGINISTGVSDLWVDPSSTSSTKITGTGSQSITEIDALYLRQSSATPNVSLTLDNLSISTDFDDAKTFPVAAVEDPTSFSASVQSTEQIDLSWTDNASSDNVLLAWNSSNTFGTPIDGQTYSASDAISGGGTVLQYSATDSYSHTSLTQSTTYYYKAWSYDGSTYSSGATTDATTLKVEPTNHPTSFSASSSYQSIEITWTDAATGSQAPDGYLILGETDSTITDPSDGTAVSDDTDASGNAVAKNVTHGSGASYTFSSLTASTKWYFEIFSYTNSGSTIDYKTDGTIATANATTGSLPNAWINEIHYDNASTDENEGVEIVIENPGDYTLSDFTVTLYNGNGGASYGTHTIDDFTPGNIEGDFRLYYKMISGIQNGAPDGIALDCDGALIQFLSYEGTFNATDGVANGFSSTDIGVSEGAGTSSQSLQLTGSGTQYSDFSWEAGLTQTWGTQNEAGDQSLPVELTSFTARVERGAVVLEWVTESEIENLGFVVERRQASGGSSQAEWTEIASYITDEALRGQGSVTYRTEYTFTDKIVESGQSYDYRLADVSYAGEKVYHALNVLGVAVTEIPEEFALFPAYPNPFNPVTTISYQITEPAFVKLSIYDISGRLVEKLVSENKKSGYYSVNWNADRVGSGIYFYRINAGEFSSVKKCLIVK